MNAVQLLNEAEYKQGSTRVVHPAGEMGKRYIETDVHGCRAPLGKWQNRASDSNVNRNIILIDIPSEFRNLEFQDFVTENTTQD